MKRVFRVFCLCALTMFLGWGALSDSGISVTFDGSYEEILDLLRRAVPKAADSIEIPGKAYVEMLKEKACALAEAEIVKFNEIEQQYRDEVEFHEFMTVAPTRLFQKSYREFRDYELTDIYRSDSYLTPVVYEIKYSFDYYTTPQRHIEGDEEGAKKTCQDDQGFKLYTSNSLVRRYRCNAEGEYDGKLADLPAAEELFIEKQKDPDEPGPNAMPPPPEASEGPAPQAQPAAQTPISLF